MPKKFKGENSKAVAAKARKETLKVEKNGQKKKLEEDALWKDDDKHVLKKQQRKLEQESKKQELADKKAANKALLEEELASIKIVSKPAPTPKITRTQIHTNMTKLAPEKKEDEKPEIQELPLEENVNRLIIDGEEARTVDDALVILGSKQEIDKHPEKRLKAAYAAFEERRLKELKQEQPSLRLSQMKEIIFKEFQKSPENPLNSK